MTTLSLEGTLLEAVGGGSLGLADGGRGLESDAEVNGSAVGDTTLDTTGVVSLSGEALSTVGGGDGSEGVIVDGSRDLTAAEAGADFETLCSGDTEHGVAELSLELVEARLAETDGDVADYTGDCSTDAIVVVPEFLDHLGHALGGGGVGASDGCEFVDCFAGDGFEELEVFGVGGGGWVFGGWGVEVLVADGGDEADDLNTMRQLQVLFGDGASGNTT